MAEVSCSQCDTTFETPESMALAKNVCFPCYKKNLASKGIEIMPGVNRCPGCAETKNIVYKNLDGKRACIDCYTRGGNDVLEKSRNIQDRITMAVAKFLAQPDGNRIEKCDLCPKGKELHPASEMHEDILRIGPGTKLRPNRRQRAVKICKGCADLLARGL